MVGRIFLIAAVSCISLFAVGKSDAQGLKEELSEQNQLESMLKKIERLQAEIDSLKQANHRSSMGFERSGAPTNQPMPQADYAADGGLQSEHVEAGSTMHPPVHQYENSVSANQPATIPGHYHSGAPSIYVQPTIVSDPLFGNPGCVGPGFNGNGFLGNSLFISPSAWGFNVGGLQMNFHRGSAKYYREFGHRHQQFRRSIDD